jgi:hypothetical protein
VEAWLAYRYGTEALAFIRENLPAVSIGVAVALVLFTVGLMVWQRRPIRSA